MKSSALILLTAVLIFGCKGSERTSSVSSGTTGNVGPITEQSERAYTENEMAIGKRICGALKQKRELFETMTDMQGIFRLKGEMTSCTTTIPSNIAEFNVAISNASSTDMEYIASGSRTNYFKDILHDQNGAMKSLCDELTKTTTVSNTSTDGNTAYVVNLLVVDGLDKFEVIKKIKSNKSYNIVSAETVAVFTKEAQAGVKFIGVEKERIRYTPCSGSKNYTSLKQVWVSAVSSF